MAIAAVLVGSFMWLTGLLLPRSRRRFRLATLRYPEFWMPLGAFIFGGGSVLQFLLPDLSPNADVLLVNAPLIAVCIAVSISSLLRRPSVYPAGLFLLAVFVVLLTHSLVTEPSPMAWLSFLILIPAIVTPQGGYSFSALLSGMKLAITLLILELVGFCLIAPETLIGSCRLDKCSVWGTSLGNLGSGNALGMCLSILAGVSLLYARTKFAFISVACGSWILVDLTASRSALVTLLAGCFVAVLFAWDRAHSRGVTIRLAVIVAAIPTVGIGLIAWPAEAFTGRPILWQRALELFGAQPLLGYGSSYWVRQSVTSTLDGNYSAHNLFLELLVSVGVLGLACLASSLLFIIWNSRSYPGAVATALASVWLVSGISEVAAAPGRSYLLPGILLLVYAFHQSKEVVETNPIAVASNHGYHEIAKRNTARAITGRIY